MSTKSIALVLPLALALAGDASAQAEARTYSIRPGQGGSFTFSTNEDGDRAVLGVTTSTGSARDTLGVLVSSVYAGGPAEKAGIEEGARIASINGVNLKLAAADVGDWDMSNAMSRRLTRELGKVKAGEEVELRVYMAGQTKTVKVKTVAADDLYKTRSWVSANADRDDDRAVLGVGLGSSGSKRDTLGVLISSVTDDGPAAKAGLEEGNRVQSINGVDLRVAREDAGDFSISSAKVSRLQRELAKLKAGDEVTLKVYQGAGRVRDYKIKTARRSDLKEQGSSFFFTTPMAPTPARPPVELFRDNLGSELRGRIQQLAPTIRSSISRRVII